MEYVTRKFENTSEGLAQKDAHTKQLVSQGFRIISEQVEKGHIKGGEQCCGALICLPFIFLARRTPSIILVTYGREIAFCRSCGNAVGLGMFLCSTCNANKVQTITAGKHQAAQRTASINTEIERINSILIDCLSVDQRVDWTLSSSDYSVPPPQPGSVEYNKEVTEWRISRATAEEQQAIKREETRQLYMAKDFATMLRYWERVLKRSGWPLSWPRSCSFDYEPIEQRLIVDFGLPPVSSLPPVGEVWYDESLNRLNELPVSEHWRAEMYRELLVKIALRTIYELFQSDGAGSLSAVAFNGAIQSVDRSTGRETNTFLISLEATKSEFADLNLRQVDPHACFTRFKGRLSDDPIKLVPIVPLPRREVRSEL